ncbi:hypothetical protein SEA_FUZZBUSTER_22 [Microbacterium phage FuzzBuster]|uniref:Uncharacterized protein n=1 Tax=Microbacterium phage FuzzBuster TaxID=2590935 RepID=A0A516KUZ9_9CAUD|nr:hypothetical protein SEA_FUZZBUSTER_22 [Microbacterium phage FuzzBuster]
MKYLIGFLAGVGAAWAALAIFQRVPELGPIDAIDEAWPPPPEVDREAFERAADGNQLRYRSQHRAGLGAIRR